MLHTVPHPLAGKTIKIKFAKGHFQIPDSEGKTFDYRVEGWWDQLTGKSWMFSDGNPAALVYAFRSSMADNLIPTDDEVLYGKIGNFGHLVHVSEIVEVGGDNGNPEA